jgi:hypothetical protein
MSVPSSRIACMFDPHVTAGVGVRPGPSAGARPGRSPNAADWADEHTVDVDDPFATGPAGGTGKFVASDGTPWIDEYLAPEYGALRQTSTGTAADLIVDALDLRHRFPALWQAVQHLQVEVWTARKISKGCRDLSATAAALVDAELAAKGGLGAALDAAVKDPDRGDLERRPRPGPTQAGPGPVRPAGVAVRIRGRTPHHDHPRGRRRPDGDPDPVDQRPTNTGGDRPTGAAKQTGDHGATPEDGEPTCRSPPDWPEPDWDREPPDDDPNDAPPFDAHRDPGHGTRAPTPGADGPDAPSAHGLDPSGLRFDLPRLLDYLTTQGLKPTPPRAVFNVHLTDQALLTGHGVV